MKKIVALLACIAVSCVSFQACGQNKELNIQPPSSGNTGGDDKTPEPEPGPVDNIATRRTMQMGLGWNLGNNLDAYEEDPEDKETTSCPAKPYGAIPRLPSKLLTK